MPAKMSKPESYTRTIVVPMRPLTARKRGLLNRQMKHYLRVRKYAAEYFQQPDVSVYDFGYGERNELRKEIARKPDVSINAQTITCGIVEVAQNYGEFEKDRRASEPWPEGANVVAYSGQTGYLFSDGGGWYFCAPATNGDLILPLDVSADEYHQQAFPEESAAPDAGRRPGIPLSDFEPSDFRGRVTGIGQSSVVKSTGGYELHMSVSFEKHVERNVSEPRYIVGVDRGRNQLFYAALYDSDKDRVVAWEHENGDRIEHTMDQLAARLSEYQENGVFDKLTKLRKRRRRFKKQKDFEAANAVVDLAREAREHGGLDGESVCVVLEELSGMNRLGNYAAENRRFNEWSHYRLEKAVGDKAEPYDIPVHTVRPEFTSQHCSRCGCEDTHRSGVHFACDDCGYQQHADANAAVNIAKRYSGS